MGFRKQPPPLGKLLKFLDNHTNQEGTIHFGVSDKTFAGWLRYLRIFYRLRDKKKPPPRELLEMFLQKHTLKCAVIAFDVKMPTLRRWLKELDLEKEFHFDPKGMLSLSDAAEYLKLSRTTLSVWFRDGLIPGATKKNATRVEIPLSSIEYLEKVRDSSQLSWPSALKKAAKTSPLAPAG